MTTNVLQTILLFGLGLILICLGGDKLVDAAVAIARKLGIPQIVVGATIVSLGTTLPEILVSTTAAFQGSAAIAAGNAFGSVICNTALIAGLTQTIRPMDKVETRSVGWRAAFFFATIAIADIVGLLTGAFNRVFGAILLLTFAVYAWLNIRWASGEGEEGESAMLYFGANLLVDNGIILAQLMGVPERVIAVTFIALGTSLPELVTSVVSIIKGYGNVGLGNIIGANLFNLLLVMGIPAAVAGIPLERSTLMVDVPVGFLVMAVLIVPILLRKKASRLQGILLLAIYGAYCWFSFA